MYSSSTPSQQMRKHAYQIEKWLNAQSLKSLQQILTIKHPKHIKILQKILYYECPQKQFRPIQLKKIGFSYSTLYNLVSKRLYQKGEENQKQKLNELTEKLYDNIIISRDQKFHVTIHRSFFTDLRELIKLISQGLAFSTLQLKGDQNENLLWFNFQNTFYSLAQWIVYFLEKEIGWAYLGKQKINTEFFQFLQQQLMVNEAINTLLTRAIKIKKFKSEKISKLSDDQKNELNFYMTKCLDRIKLAQFPYDQIVWLNWLNYNSESSYEEIFNTAALLLQQKYKQWSEEKFAREIDEELMKTKQKNKKKNQKKAQKKKLTKNSEAKQENKTLQTDEKKQILEEVRKEIEFVNQELIKNAQVCQEILQEKDPIQEIVIEEKKGGNIIKEFPSKKNKKYVPKYSQENSQKKEEKPKEEIKVEEEFSASYSIQNEDVNEKTESHSYFSQSDYSHEQSVLEHNFSEGLKKSNKHISLIRSRMNESFEFYRKQLEEKAKPLEKYRKIALFILEKEVQYLLKRKQKDIFKQKSITKWNLEVFGSYPANFALKQSDIDLVLLQEPRQEKKIGLTLEQIFEYFKLKQWAIDCKLFSTAQIPIITFSVNIFVMVTVNLELITSQGNFKLAQKILNKIKDHTFTVDLSLWNYYQAAKGQQKEGTDEKIMTPYKQHTGIRNTKILIQLFENYPELRNVCLVLKQFVRVRNLNKPYKGGISSYVLVMMVYIVLMNKHALKKTQKENDTNYVKYLKTFCEFMAEEFVPFKTVLRISNEKSKKKNKPSSQMIQQNIEEQQQQPFNASMKELHLKIECPFSKNPLKTSAFQIDSIIAKLQDLLIFIKQTEYCLGKINSEEKKKMKKECSRMLEQFIYHQDEQSKI